MEIHQWEQSKAPQLEGGTASTRELPKGFAFRADKHRSSRYRSYRPMKAHAFRVGQLILAP